MKNEFNYYEDYSSSEFDGVIEELVGKEYSEEEWISLIEKHHEGTYEENKHADIRIYYAMMPFVKYLAKKYYNSYMPHYTEDLESAEK